MRYHEQMQYVLEKMNNGAMIITYSEIHELVRDKINNEELDIVIKDLKLFSYIIENAAANKIGLTVEPHAKRFLKGGGFIKQFEDDIEDEVYRKSERQFNKTTRHLVLGIGILSLLVTFGFGVYSCINDSNKKLLPEIQSLKIEVIKLKASVDSLPFQQKSR